MGPARRGAALVLVAALAGCGESAPTTREDGLAVAYDEPTGGGGNSALLTGVVEDLDGCLVVQQDGGGQEEPYVPVFPSNDSTARDVTEGSTVELGGGWTPELDADADIPDACPTDGPFWVVAQPD
ncbi:hypothetical protein [uncultured Pseudokineococcus sp.]|uniref:hypothetical protein n=1 Tax=uncultured Pseudokineococcus sp. TaxID=1642928 RepID=UPI002613720F|nr:hypothetical protein [uncultured Pseudokineococcus sp.]